LGDCDFTVRATNGRVADLSANGARVTVDYYLDDTDPTIAPIRCYSGEITNVHGEGRAEQAIRTFTVTDDWNVLNTTLGWANPTGADTNQGTAAYYTRTGPAEDVALDVIGANATRLGLNLSVPASAGRGSTITAKFRMHPLADRLWPAVDQAGIGIRVVQQNAQRAVQVYQPVTYPRILTETSGIVQGNSWDVTRALVTRTMVGAGGQDVARVFRHFVNTALETSLGTALEVFVDARDVDQAAPDLVAQLQARSDQALAQFAATASLNLTLVERGSFRYGKTFNLGDRISMQTLNGPVITDLVRAVDINMDQDAGLTVTPIVGNWSDSSTDSGLAKIVAQLAKSLRDQGRR
jgi:hypothetical protein